MKSGDKVVAITKGTIGPLLIVGRVYDVTDVYHSSIYVKRPHDLSEHSWCPVLMYNIDYFRLATNKEIKCSEKVFENEITCGHYEERLRKPIYVDR